VTNPNTKEGRMFRRRFRLPFPCFTLLLQICKDYNIFDMKYDTKPILEAKILGCLRILGRGSCADEVNELSANTLGESTMNYVFKKFIVNMTNRVYNLFINPPQGEYLREVQATYAALGLPGCCGSMDCTHVKWTLCPKGKKHHASGKDGFPTLVFQVVVDHNKRVMHVSQSFLGSVNDKTICENDLFSLGIKHGSLQHVEYELYDSCGIKYRCKGGYLIVDGGYIDCICFIDPDKHHLHRDGVLWSEWLESVRKDVECFFGILKQRWRFFKNGVVHHTASTIWNMHSRRHAY
jgi:hypothetical protein